MRPFHVFIFSLLFHVTTYAQVDTLYVNDTHTMALVFPNPIIRAITGHPNYTFGFDPNTPGRLGLLQGHPGTDSNLLVLTNDGRAYSFLLAYRKELKEGHRFVHVDKSIGNVGSEKWLDTLGQGINPSTKPSIKSDSIQYRKVSTYFLKRARAVLRSKHKDGIVLRLRDLAYYGTETYLIMEIENRSAIDFEVDFVQVFKAHGNLRKKSSYQKLALDSIYKYRMPSMVKVGQRQRFAFVVPKFTLGEREKLMLELREKRGSRQIWLQWH